MLKRTLSGIMAAVLLFLSIPFTAFADTTTEWESKMNITTKWLTSMYYQASDKDDEDGITLNDIQVRMLSNGNERYITLAPFFDSTGANFKHVKFKSADMTGFGDPDEHKFVDVTVDKITNDKFNYSLTKYGKDELGHIALGTSPGDKIGRTAESAPDAYVYGSIGVYWDSHIWPLYLWREINVNQHGIDDDGTVDTMKSGIYEEDGIDYDVSLIYCVNNTVGAEQHSPDSVNSTASYGVDPLSVYLFIAKMHCLFHDSDMWDKLIDACSEDIAQPGETKVTADDYEALSGLGITCKDNCTVTDCTSSTCPIMACLGAAYNKGPDGYVDGYNEEFASAVDIFYQAKEDTEAGRRREKDTVSFSTYLRNAIGLVIDEKSYIYRGATANQGNTTTQSLKAASDLIKGGGLELPALSEYIRIMQRTDYDDSSESDLCYKYTYNLLHVNGWIPTGEGSTEVTSSNDSYKYYVELSTMLSRTYEGGGMSSHGNEMVGYIGSALASVTDMTAQISTERTASNETTNEQVEANRQISSGSLSLDGKKVDGLLALGYYIALDDALTNTTTTANALTSTKNRYNTASTAAVPKDGSASAWNELRKGYWGVKLLDDVDAMIRSLTIALDSNDTWEGLIEYMYGGTEVVDKTTSVNSHDDALAYTLNRALKICNKGHVGLEDDTKLNFLHSLWVAYYGKGCLSDKPTMVTNGLDDFSLSEETSLIVDAQISTFNAQYKVAKSAISAKGMEGGCTLELRSEIIDFYAKYALPEDDLIKTVVKDTIGFIETKDTNWTVSTSVLNYAPVNYKNANQYFYYQMLLLTEAYYYRNHVYLDLVTSVLDKGVTLENNGRALTTLSAIKTVTDKYRGSRAGDIWNGIIKDDSVSLTEEYSSLSSLSGLYEYMLKLGMLSSDEYTIDIYDDQDPITLFWTQTGGNITFSADYYKGRALSATYVPMQTNIYDPYTMLDYVDLDWIEDFHYKYGFHRKALLIDTNVDSATDSYVSHTEGATRVATLQDLFNCESDIVLYVDEHFYGLSELSELQNKTYDRLASTNPTFWESLSNSISDMFSVFREVDFDVAMKHTENSYSFELANAVSDMTWSLEFDENGKPVNEKRYDQYILAPSEIKKYIASTEYTPMMGYALVSNIYRNSDAYNTLAVVSGQRTPVFESSPTLATINGASRTAENTLYNYALLKNLKDMSTVGYETSTDMTSPIYCDIYGNIVTESGLVVIPAACNATLHNGNSTWQPIATGFLSTYGNSWSIPADWNLDPEFMNQMFIKNEETGVWEIRNKTIQNVDINFAQLSYSDKAVNVAIKEMYNYDLVFGGQLDQYNSLNVLHETLRGAPLENIDFDAENLNSARRVDKSGLIAAAKLDNIVSSIDWDDENSLMSIPRLSFIDNYQYVVVFIFKVLFVIIVTALMLTVYIDALKASISFKTAGRCVLTLVLGVASVLLIPVSYDISYYQSNKLLLQDEAEYIMMLNTEKHMSGREIGVYEVTEPKANTQILIKLEDFEFNWVSELPNVIFSDSINIMDEKYQEFLNNSLIASADNVQAMNDGMYMDIQDIFDTSVLNFSTSSKQLYQKVSVDPVASYYMPYYYFLDALLTNMNDYNRSNNIYAYSTKIMRGGAVKTVNLCDSYFSSKEFMESSDTDYLGLYQLYETMGSMYILPIFDSESVEQARGSQWYVGTFMNEEDRLERIELMTQKVREYVTANKDLIGKVTDETFLKCMAMSLALEYNDIFGIPSASALEIYNLSNADLMRLSVADKAATLEGSPMSFSRFVYNEAGTPGVYAGVFLVIITMFVQTMKTVITLAIMALLIISVYVFKILLRKSTNSIGGYLLTLLIICSTNILYAFILKLSLYIPQTGLSPTLCIIIQILIQLGYLIILCVVLSFALRDWKNFGFTHYQNIGTKIKNKFSNVFRGRHSRTPQQRYDSEPRGKDGWEYYRNLVKENERRMKKVGN